MVYSGKLNRTTAFNTLFSDLKKLGVTDKSSNDAIEEKFCNYVRFADEQARALDNNEEELGRQLAAKGNQVMAMANSSGATVQECRKAVQEGRTLPNAPGITDVTSDFGDSSGLFSDPGRRQFIADIHRPQMPKDTSGNPVIDEKDNVFRFRIGGAKGQTFRAEICADAGCVVIYAEIGYPPPEANGKFGEIMLKANHLYLGTNGGTLCQNPDTDAYVLMRTVPLAPLEGAETFGAIMEDVLLQVDNWRELMNGLRAAEVEEEEQTKEDGRLASGGFMQV